MLIYYKLKHNIVEDTLPSFSYSIKNNFNCYNIIYLFKLSLVDYSLWNKLRIRCIEFINRTEFNILSLTEEI